MASTKYTPSEANLNKIVDVFHKYSHKSKTGEEDALEKNEFEGLIKEEAPAYYAYLQKKKESLESIFKQADLDHDQHMFFPEFVLVLALIAVELHKEYHEKYGPEGPDGPEGPGQQGHGHSHGHSHSHGRRH